MNPMARSGNIRGKMPGTSISINMGKQNPMTKSNVTLWKNPNYSSAPKSEETKEIENEFIDNLKKQIYFMEMELNLMKEREKEIQKSGGFTNLFNDDKDPFAHIQKLKTKYSDMRSKMANKIEELTNKKREVIGLNISLKAKLDSLKKLESEIYTKLMNYNDTSNKKLNEITSEFLARNNERTELDADNKLNTAKLEQEIQRNQQLEYQITSGAKMDELKQEEFDKQLDIINKMVAEKDDYCKKIDDKIELENKKETEQEVFKKEDAKNKKYKDEIKKLEEEILQLNSKVEGMELVDDYYVKKKQNVIAERKKYVDNNIELRHEIEAKTQLNDIRIQKKVKEANSEEIQKLNEHYKETSRKITELEDKIGKEVEKIKNFNNDIIRLNIELKIREENRDFVTQVVDSKVQEFTELQNKVNELNKINEDLKIKIGKEKTDNQLLRNRYKILSEEHAGVTSKYKFITENYDYTSNLKNMNMEYFNDLTNTNNSVNNTILQFAQKIGDFKSQNINKLMSMDTNY